MAREGLTAFQAVNRNFDEAAEIIDLDDEMRSILTTTYREISVQIPLRLDNGERVWTMPPPPCDARPPAR